MENKNEAENITESNSLSSLKFVFSRTAWSALGYNIVSSVIAWIYLIVVPSTMFISLPFMAFFEAKLERKRVCWLDYPEIEDPQPAFPINSNLTIWEKIKIRFNEQATWRSIGYSLMLTVWGMVVFLVDVILFPVCFVLLFSPLIIPFVPYTFGAYSTNNILFGLGACLVGVLLFILTIYLNYFLAKIQISFANSMLSPTDREYQQQINSLKTSRSNLNNNFDMERKKMERNLHDGPQQKLVALNMQLGSLEAEYKDNPQLQKQLNESQQYVEAALAEMRDLVKGIYPQVLEDYGIEAALTELSSPIPLEIKPSENWYRGARFSAEIENAMYYTACEAISNACKYADANKIIITLAKDYNRLEMAIIDDGKGGANFGNPAESTGLIGLRERAHSVGAEFTLTSPVGGPTVILWSKTL